MKETIEGVVEDLQVTDLREPAVIGRQALKGAKVHELPVSGPHNQTFAEAYLGDMPFTD